MFTPDLYINELMMSHVIFACVVFVAAMFFKYVKPRFTQQKPSLCVDDDESDSYDDPCDEALRLKEEIDDRIKKLDDNTYYEYRRLHHKNRLAKLQAQLKRVEQYVNSKGTPEVTPA